MPDRYFCGPQWLPRWVRRPISEHYNECCRSHDEGYSPWHSRDQADEAFRREIAHKMQAIRELHTNGEISSKHAKRVLLLGRILPSLVENFGWAFKKSRWHYRLERKMRRGFRQLKFW